MKGMKSIEVDLEELVKSFKIAYGEYSKVVDEYDFAWIEPKSLNEVLDELENDVNPRVGEVNNVLDDNLTLTFYSSA